MLLDIALGCTDSTMATILSAVKKIVSLIQIIVPILLMVGMMIHIMNLIKNPEDAKRKKNDMY